MAQSRLFIAYTAVVLLCTLGSSIVLESKIRSELETDLRARLTLKARGLAELAAKPVAASDDADLGRIVSEIARVTATRLTVVAKDGRVLADSSGDPASMENHGNRKEIVDARSAGIGFDTRRSSTTGEPYWYCAVALPDGSGFARAADRLGPFVEQVGAATALALVGILVVSALAISVGAVVGRWMGRRLEEQAEVALRIAEGDFSRRVDDEGSDGVAKVGNALNRLADELETRIAELEARKRGLALVLDSVADGLVAVGPDDVVTHVNPEARRLLELADDAIGRSYWEVVRDGDLPRLVGQVRETLQPVGATIRVGAGHRREVEVRVTPIVIDAGRYDGSVIDVRDVTVLRKLEAVRRDFVANVSHEMKTPLTSIQGYVETLQDGAVDDPETARAFLGKIERNAKSLAHLVTDLLVLSRVESGGLRIDDDPIVVASVIGESAAAVADKAREKGVVIQIVGADRDLRVRGDRDLLVRAVVNLLDNAVQYTAPGGRVEAHCVREGANVEIRVTDTGIGIPAADIERIFERFYRVDKARSRSLGGTGLGLAIVKHVAEQHGGTIRVASVEGRGSTFTLTIPLGV